MSDIAEGDLLEITHAVRVVRGSQDGRTATFRIGGNDVLYSLEHDVKSWRHIDSDDD